MLEHVADAPVRRRNLDAGPRVEHYPIAERDPPRIRTDQTGHAPQQRRFAGARLAENDRDAGRAREGDVEFEARRQTLADADVETHGSGATAHGFRTSA